MRLKPLIILLLIAGIGFAIRLKAQTGSNTLSLVATPPCTVLLSCPEFDFYAKKLVEYSGLKVDTASYIAKLKSNAIIIYQQERLLKDDSISLYNKDKIVEEYKMSFDNISKLYIREQKRNKRSKKIALMSTIGCGLLSIILILSR